MNDTVLKIALAGLMHDVGKFAERAFAVEQGDKDSVWQDYRYGHAYITERVLLDLFPEVLEQKINTHDAVNDCTVLNLAARHHAPRHAYEWMITEADRLASGHERAKADEEADFKTEGRERKSQVPLSSILGRVRLKNQNSGQSVIEDMRYSITLPPMRHSTEFEQGFPVTHEEYSAKQVRAAYKTHWLDFQNAVTRIDPIQQFETLFEICRMYQWCLPASTRKEDMADVSLFEHQKATAALASCLYCYHGNDDESVSENNVRNRDEEKYLLFCGDISGIQNFIYRISAKGAYKGLKGRSFFIQLLAEVLARKFMDTFGLTPANILYASGGKFYLLLPRVRGAEDQIAALSDEINLELWGKYGGDLFIRTGFVPMSGNDLMGTGGRNLSAIWDELGHQLVFNDRARYASLAGQHYDRFFGVGGKDEYTDCQICHRSMRKREDEKTTEQPKQDRRCSPCREMLEIGRLLGQSNYLIMASDKEAVDGRHDFRIFNRYFWFRTDSTEISVHRDCLVWGLNDPCFADIAGSGSLSTVNAAPLIVGGTHRFDREFGDIAQKSAGIPRLGILRMDVDNLGRIFSHGLRNYRHEDEQREGRFHSLGRITTLSWQLSLFFGTMVPGLIQSEEKWRDRVTVVYSGGDDLFILGAWDVIPHVALSIRTAFDRFCCGNPAWGLSGGMVMTGGKFPVYKGAEMAGEAENRAKKLCLKTTSDGREWKKNAFTMLDTAMAWSEFEEVSRIRESVFGVLQNKENRPLLSRLRNISSSWADSRERLLRTESGLSMETVRKNLEAEKWRWRMVYSLKRLAESRTNLAETIKDVQRFILNPVSDYGRQGIELLGVLSRWCELELRKPVNNKGGE